MVRKRVSRKRTSRKKKVSRKRRTSRKRVSRKKSKRQSRRRRVSRRQRGGQHPKIKKFGGSRGRRPRGRAPGGTARPQNINSICMRECKHDRECALRCVARSQMTEHQRNAHMVNQAFASAGIKFAQTHGQGYK
jgi:hypothetical protein